MEKCLISNGPGASGSKGIPSTPYGRSPGFSKLGGLNINDSEPDRSVGLRLTSEGQSQGVIMDHLPVPLNGDHVRIPLYADQRVYTPDEFFSFPARYACKNTLKIIERGLPPTMRTDTANELLQSWLFFGLLSAVTGEDVNVEHFRDTDLKGRPRVSTKRLNEFLESWVQRERHAKAHGDAEGQMLRFIRATSALNDARKFVYHHCSYKNFDRDNYLDYENADHPSCAQPTEGPAVDTAMTMSLAILGETLQHEQPKIAVSLGRRKQFWDRPNDQPKFWGQSKYLRDKLVEAKWCRRDVRRLELKMRDNSRVYFASSRKAPPSDTESHVACTFWNCKVSAREEPRHQDGCECSCSVISASEQDIERVLKAGDTPLMQYNTAGQLTVVSLHWENAELPKFGALSHSWADGLVHDSENRRSMRRCQLESLQRTFNRIAGIRGAHNVPFWVDELCLPLQTGLKGISINHIKDIYGKAFTVLVWDAGLLETKLGNDLIEANVRISTGGWAQRLWTLQEGILAQDLRFEFRGQELVKALDLEERRDQARDDLWDSHHHVWKAGPFSSAMWSLRKREVKCQVQRVWTAVQFRSSTYPSDETICLANLLGIDVQHILKITSTGSDEELSAKRMVKFLNLLEENVSLGIPSGIIFLPPPKLKVEGYSWAPASWMTEQAYSYPLHQTLQQAAQVTRLGLSVEFPGILLYPPKGPVQDRLWIAVSQNLHKWYKVVPNTQGPKWQDCWRRACAVEQPCIILSSSEPRAEYEIGVLVASKGSLAKDGTRWVRIVCRVWLRLEIDHGVIGRLCACFRENMDNVFWGERLQNDQKWCVDGGVSETPALVDVDEGAA